MPLSDEAKALGGKNVSVERANEIAEDRERILGKLREYRDEWSDEIPDERVYGGKGTEDKQTKARMEWWMVVLGNLDLALDAGLVPESLKPDVEQLIRDYSKFGGQETKPEDIKRANELLDKVLGRVPTIERERK